MTAARWKGQEMLTLDSADTKALKAVLGYVWCDEERDFQAADQDARETHIFQSIRRLASLSETTD